MKIFINGVWCDTKFDWGYKSDKDYVLHLLEENEGLKSAIANLISHLEHRFDEYEDGKWLDEYKKLIK